MKPRIEKKVVGEIKNPNHPQKGDSIRVEPIRRLEDVQAIKKILSDNPRDLLLFTILPPRRVKSPLLFKR